MADPKNSLGEVSFFEYRSPGLLEIYFNRGFFFFFNGAAKNYKFKNTYFNYNFVGGVGSPDICMQLPSEASSTGSSQSGSYSWL